MNSVQATDAACKAIERKIIVEERILERDSKILNWVSSFDVRGTYESILETTQVNSRYRRHGQWFIDHSRFKIWRTFATTSTLWLNGTIGTGKTTLMARASLDLQEDGQIGQLAYFFFQKAGGIVKAETCLQSILRQLSWDHPEGQVEPTIEAVYQDMKDSHDESSALKPGECVRLLRQVMQKKECFIMIDGLDECEDYNRLLDKLQELHQSDSEQGITRQKPLHMMISSRDDLMGIQESFIDCLVITTSGEYSEGDQCSYVVRELNEQRKVRPGSFFFASEKGFFPQLEAILVKNGGGLFRWIQIQIEFFTRTFFRTDVEIEDQMSQLRKRSLHPNLAEEYSRLLKLLGDSGRNRKLAIQMLQLVACSLEPLSFTDLSEALTGVSDETRITTADDARRILVGFVTEYDFADFLYDDSYEGTWKETRFQRPAIRLAHASVREFLEDHIHEEDGFSIHAQNAQAAALCLSCLNRNQSCLVMPANVVGNFLPGHSLKAFQRNKNLCRNALSPFVRYSCYAWHVHICRALGEDGKGISSNVEQLSEFILKGTYHTWALLPSLLPDSVEAAVNWSIGDQRVEYIYERKEFGKFEAVNPGFLIASFDLPELLALPDIPACVDPLSRSLTGDRLFFFVIRNASFSTMEAFINVYPESLKIDPTKPGTEPVGFRDQDTTALHCAVDSKSLEKVQLLLANGADVMAVNSAHRIPLALTWRSHPHKYEPEIFKALTQNMKAEAMPIKYRNEALFDCATHDLSEVMTWLLEAGLDPDLRRESQSRPTLLHEAVSHSACKIINLLLQSHPGLVRMTDTDGATPLFKAEFYITARLLLAGGADIFAVDHSGSTALHRAHNVSFFQEHACTLEANGLRGSVQRLLRMKNQMGKVAADISLWRKMRNVHRNNARTSELDESLRAAVERDGEELYEFGHPDIVEGWESRSSEGRRHWQEVLQLFAESDLSGDSCALTSEEMQFAIEYLEWHAKRSKELADQYEDTKREVERLKNNDTGSD